MNETKDINEILTRVLNNKKFIENLMMNKLNGSEYDSDVI